MKARIASLRQEQERIVKSINVKLEKVEELHKKNKELKEQISAVVREKNCIGKNPVYDYFNYMYGFCGNKDQDEKYKHDRCSAKIKALEEELKQCEDAAIVLEKEAEEYGNGFGKKLRQLDLDIVVLERRCIEQETAATAATTDDESSVNEQLIAYRAQASLIKRWIKDATGMAL
jgi:hypothetical protein